MRSHPTCAVTGRPFLLLRVGDYAAGAATAVAAAAAIHALIDTGSDMVLAMLAGMALGLLAYLLVLAVAGPLVGFLQVMAPGGVIGMYGGALFAMRDSMGMEDRAVTGRMDEPSPGAFKRRTQRPVRLGRCPSEGVSRPSI